MNWFEVGPKANPKTLCLTTKICNDILPTAITLKKWHLQANDFCVLCGARKETSAHILCCHHPSRKKWRSWSISKLRTTINNQDTALLIQDTICKAITEWFDTGVVQIGAYPQLLSTQPWFLNIKLVGNISSWDTGQQNGREYINLWHLLKVDHIFGLLQWWKQGLQLMI